MPGEAEMGRLPGILGRTPRRSKGENVLRRVGRAVSPGGALGVEWRREAFRACSILSGDPTEEQADRVVGETRPPPVLGKVGPGATWSSVRAGPPLRNRRNSA